MGLWTQCFAWWTVSRVEHQTANGYLTVRHSTQSARVGICVDRRVGFGGAFAPNRFERVSLMAAALAQQAQAAFDATQPLPACAQRWVAERRALQESGDLPTDEAQRSPTHIQAFIDDINGVALDDPVTVPDAVKHIRVDPSTTRAAGGVPAEEGCRAHVHARLCILALRRIGLEEAEGKTTVGDPMISLGLLVDRSAATMRCPEAKRTIMLAQIASAEAAAVVAPPTVSVSEAEKLVGRACNLSQVLPELTATLQGGYTIIMAAARAAEIGRGWRPGGRSMQLRAGSRAHVGWLEFLRTTSALVQANEGVALAPQLIFPDRHQGNALTSTTDASGVDGVGGYAFSAAAPGCVWITSEPWPADVLAALQAAGTKRKHRAARDDSTLPLPSGTGAREGEGEQAHHLLSMPAAELFGAWAVPRAAMMAGARKGPIFAIGDCDAAVGALNAANSGVPQMRVLTRAARRLCSEWLGVSVGREANLDADRLSHPHEAEAVAAEAERAGLRVIQAPIDELAWATLRQAIGAEGRGARERDWLS